MSSSCQGSRRAGALPPARRRAWRATCRMGAATACLRHVHVLCTAGDPVDGAGGGTAQEAQTPVGLLPCALRLAVVGCAASYAGGDADDRSWACNVILSPCMASARCANRPAFRGAWLTPLRLSHPHPLPNRILRRSIVEFVGWGSWDSSTAQSSRNTLFLVGGPACSPAVLELCA